MLHIQSPSSGPLNNGMSFLALGFRPFFLFAGISAILLLGLWLAVLMGVLAAPAYYGGIHWHGHEMLFGYSAAVMAGFLLTATKNWTGFQTLRYWPLGGLALLWLAGRLLPWLPLPGMLIALVDGLFLPLLALALAFPLFRSRQRHNIPFVFLLLTMALGNLLAHLQLLGLSQTLVAGQTLAIGMVLTLLVVMGGRVIPFFIERGLPGAVVRKWQWLEWLSLPSILLYVAIQLWSFPNWLVAVVIALAALVHGWRVVGWYQAGIWSVSLLWVLWLGYAFISMALLVQLGEVLGWLPGRHSLHVLTVGAIGVLTLGMMARVSIGHSGRQMQAHPLMAWAFALLVAAVVLRSLLPLVLPELYLWWLKLAGLSWIVAFLCFVAIYLPMLIKPRVDGQPG